jgi:hypothetical protein
MTHLVRRLATATTLAAAITTAGLVGALAPANADTDAPTCDQVALDATAATAATSARAAQKAYTTYTHTAIQSLVAQLKAKEVREAKVAAAKAKSADRRADAAEEAARHSTAGAAEARQARADARVARSTARLETRQAAAVQRASKAQLLHLVKAERARLKSVWDSAKEALAVAKADAEACETASVPTADPTAV